MDCVATAVLGRRELTMTLRRNFGGDSFMTWVAFKYSGILEFSFFRVYWNRSSTGKPYEPIFSFFAKYPASSCCSATGQWWKNSALPLFMRGHQSFLFANECIHVVVRLAPKVLSELCHAVLKSMILENSLSEYNIYSQKWKMSLISLQNGSTEYIC